MTIPFLSFFKKVAQRFSLKGVIYFWYRHYKALLFVGFLIILAVGSWDWYQSLYRYHFSDEEKKQYIESYSKETVFQEAKFRGTVDVLTARVRLHEAWLPLTRNIFEGKGIQPKQ